MNPIVLGLIAVVVALWLLWRKKKMSFFKKYNIPGPEPSLFFGNFWEIYREGQHNCIRKWVKEYGKVFGYYYGTVPILIVADLDMIRTIQQKEFHKFADRPPLFDAGRPRTTDHAITRVRGQKWKTLRSVITPTFTTSKLKMMTPIVKQSVEELCDAVEKKSAKGEIFNVYRLYQNLTMDVIARSSLGFYTNCQKNENEPFLKLMRLLLSINMSFLVFLTFSFTELSEMFKFIRSTILGWKNEGRSPRDELMERTAEAIKQRRNDPNSHRKDLLQLMMDAQKTDENINDSSLAASENDEKIIDVAKKQGSPTKGVKMNDKEVLDNAVLFLFAGYETTSTALAFATHFLTKYPNIQDKVREELKNNVTNSKEISYDVLHKLSYLESVIYESLRLQPPITYFVNREALEDTVVEGVRIPKGIGIQIPVYYLHHDPSIWDDPEEFKPERFSPEEKANRHPMAFQPFGAGPRNCVGLRFALLEIKMALAKLLFDYKFVKGNPDEKFVVSHSPAIDRPANGVFIKAEKL